METDYETVYAAIEEGIDLLEHDSVATADSDTANSNASGDTASAQTASDVSSPLYILLDLQKKINEDFPTPSDTNFQEMCIRDSCSSA